MEMHQHETARRPSSVSTGKAVHQHRAAGRKRALNKVEEWLQKVEHRGVLPADQRGRTERRRAATQKHKNDEIPT